ncbi:MAG: phosphopentomutase [Planctomycetota bacterium]|nr:MAG: phosphopentomutase [Planctomycetota bacterium]
MSFLASSASGSRGAGRRFRRVFLVVFDSAGIGGAPDAAAFGDAGSDTLGHVHAQVGLRVPALARLGLRRLLPLGEGDVEGAWGRMCERSAGKDTTTGHWEIAGGWLERPFPVFPEGFPPEVIEPFERVTGLPVLCNRPASGTEVIERYGAEHLASGGRPIVYTSADSVFQVAAHVEVVPLERLYRWCEAAREILRGPYEVGRVIARPFAGEPGRFRRLQEYRRDYSVAPPPGLLPEVLCEAGLGVYAIGKIEDIFAGRGITRAVHTGSNAEGLARLHEAAAEANEALVFANLVDFDALYGHRNDPKGYARALEEADAGIAALLPRLAAGDLLVITADHGNDPTTPSTDHSREMVPLLVWARGIEPVDVGTRPSFADLGQTIADNFGLRVPHGRSFLELLRVHG